MTAPTHIRTLCTLAASLLAALALLTAQAIARPPAHRAVAQQHRARRHPSRRTCRTERRPRTRQKETKPAKKATGCAASTARSKKRPKPRPAPAPPVTAPVSVTQTTADLSEELSPQPALEFSPAGNAAGAPVIHVDESERYQTFTGVGAAMTDSSAWLIWDELPPDTRDALLGALFSPAGAHLNFLRVPMGASDFSALGVPYTYDDQPPGQSDPSLADFSIAHDEAYIVPALREAEALDPNLYLEAMPWSPPAWMKANDALDDIDHAGSLLPQYYPALAQYFVKFLQAYAGQGVHIAAIAPQNEPNVATQYPGLDLSQQQEATFIADDLRPALDAAGLSPAVFGWDLSWAPLGSSDPLVAQAAAGTIAGLAAHCYFGSPTFMTGIHDAAPGSQQLVDECTTGSGGSGNNWATAELLIASLRNWANGVALWNLALDPSGGPVQPPNSGCPGCTGVATVDEQTGTYTLSGNYYELAQLSHFVEPGAVRIGSEDFVSYQLTPSYTTQVTGGVDDVAFQNPDGSDVLMAYNNNTVPITFAIEWRGSYVDYTIPAGATTTFQWR